MSESVLLQLQAFLEERQSYCIICLRTECERRLKHPKYLRKVIESLNNLYIFDNRFQLVCFLCERQAATAYSFLMRVHTAVKAHGAAKEFNKPFYRNKFCMAMSDTDEYPVKKRPVWLKEMVDCEEKMRKQRASTQLLKTEILIVCSDVVESVEPSPLPGESQDMYVVPDDVPQTHEIYVKDEDEVKEESFIICDDDDVSSDNVQIIEKTADTEQNINVMDKAFGIDTRTRIDIGTRVDIAPRIDIDPRVGIGPRIDNEPRIVPRIDTGSNTGKKIVFGLRKNTGTKIIFGLKDTEPIIDTRLKKDNGPRIDTGTKSASIIPIPIENLLNNSTNKPTAEMALNQTNIFDNNPNKVMLHPIVLNSGLLTVPTLSVNLLGNQLVLTNQNQLNLETPQIAVKNGENFTFITNPVEVNSVLKKLGQHNGSMHSTFKTNTPLNTSKSVCQTNCMGISVSEPHSLSEPQRGEPHSRLEPHSRGEPHSRLEPQRGEPQGKLPQLRSDRIDWEDKIPMDVISFVDEKQENLCKRARRDDMPGLGICNVTSLSDPLQSDVIDLC